MRYEVISPRVAIKRSSETLGRKEIGMRYLTSKQIEEMSWKSRRLYFLEKYEEDAKRWQNESDDRKLFSVMYDNLKEAIESMSDNPNLTICVAVNEYIRKEEEVMDRIQKHFEGR